MVMMIIAGMILCSLFLVAVWRVNLKDDIRNL
jgi:hypothetical protein